MKRIFILLILMLAISPVTQAFAATTVSLWSHYDPVKDNYMVAYYKQIPDRPSSMKVKFVNTENAAANAQKVFSGSDITGIFYLTCNGQYNFDFYDSGGILVSSSQQMTTTQVKNTLCDSYPSPTDMYNGAATPPNENGVEVKPADTPSGPRNYLYWEPSPNCGNAGYSYLFYRDGVFDHEFDPYTENLYQYDITDKPGVWTVVTDYGSSYCRDLVGETVYQDGGGNPTDPWAGVPAPGDGSSPNGPKGEPGSGDGGNGGVVYPPFDPLCDTCVQLNQLLQCPDWDTYMGELTKAFQDALPPPPDWDHIADIIGRSVIDKLEEYHGPVPDPPTVPEIKGNTATPLPNIDATVPDASNLKPMVPDDYNQPKPFNLDNAPVIEVKDESRPFDIQQPLSNIEYDPPGVQRKPGESTNNTGGIQKPANVSLPNPKPKPSGSTTPGPSSPVPKPTTSPSTVPHPNTSAGTVPKPSGIGGPGPKPTGLVNP